MIDLDNTLFNINVASAIPSAGSFLVAEPFLREQHFNHAVILLLDYFPYKSAMGIVMNKLSGYKLSELMSESNIKKDVAVYCGGPVSTDRLFYIHRLPQFISGSSHIVNDLYVGGDFDDVCSYISQGLPLEGNIRFFIGYSGWDDGQLDEEVNDHVWATAPALKTSRYLTGDEDAYWHSVVRELGSRYRGWRYQPMDPKNN